MPTEQDHADRHKSLHRYLDELVADWLMQTKSLPSKCTVLELITWSAKQNEAPDHKLEKPD